MSFNSNVKFLRNRKGLTQESVAAALGFTRVQLNGYENGGIINPTVNALLSISKYYGIPVDALLKTDLSKLSDAQFADLEHGNESHIKGSKLRVLATTIDKNNRENIEVVNLKAVAGYRNGYADPEFVNGLPSFQLPILYNDRKYRMFQISGDSMLPIPDKSWVITEYVENWHEIKDGNAYIILTQEDGVVFKIAVNQIKRKKKLILHSLNKQYQPYEVPIGEVREVWKFCNYLSAELPDTNWAKDELLSAVNRLESEIKLIKEKVVA